MELFWKFIRFVAAILPSWLSQFQLIASLWRYCILGESHRCRDCSKSACCPRIWRIWTTSWLWHLWWCAKTPALILCIKWDDNFKSTMRAGKRMMTNINDKNNDNHDRWSFHLVGSLLNTQHNCRHLVMHTRQGTGLRSAWKSLCDSFYTDLFWKMKRVL